MVISIRRSRHEEGEELVAIWCRSVDATHDFLSAEYRAELEVLVRSFLPEAPLWVAVNERDHHNVIGDNTSLPDIIDKFIPAKYFATVLSKENQKIN